MALSRIALATSLERQLANNPTPGSTSDASSPKPRPIWMGNKKPVSRPEEKTPIQAPESPVFGDPAHGPCPSPAGVELAESFSCNAGILSDVKVRGY
ncbi:uncharacterized protein TrAFT101_011858 [Trichoderma asperellum]|uniref:uncharacterized protein n=1 Tax=Trichoderma asperellum TaxID=101201 RepID=UPI003317486A|nr:hypothetical protein TrAFT101_011858 [Trichoderma asperellum]